ncbi:MAG: GGDEF domain-containing protein, partial [Gammaproteobacteria bacterium]
AARLRSSDVGARLGGDEFAVLLPDTDLGGAKIFFTSLREELLSVARKNNWPIGYSIGVGVFSDFGSNIDEAIKCSDNLMYKVKESGKNAILYAEFSKQIVTKD